MANTQHAAELAAIVDAVDKKSSFRQLATYNIRMLTQVAKKELDQLDTKATTHVVTALKKHQDSKEMLDIALECLMVLAEEPRQAVALIECGGLELSLASALERQESAFTSTTLEHFEKIVAHARAASLICSNDTIDLLGKLTTQCVHGNDLDTIARCVGAIDQLTRAVDDSNNLSPAIVNTAFSCLEALSKSNNDNHAMAIVTACKVAQRGSMAQQKHGHSRRQSEATAIGRRRRKSTLNSRGSIGARGSLSSSRPSLSRGGDSLSPEIGVKKKANRRLSMATQGVSNKSLDTCVEVLQALGGNDKVSSAIGELLLVLNHDSVETLLDAAAEEQGDGQEHALLILNAMATSVQGGEAIMWSATAASDASPSDIPDPPEGELGAQRLASLLHSAASAEMGTSNQNRGIGQQRRTLTALSLLAKASRDPLSSQALFEADVVDVLVELLEHQLKQVPHLTSDLGANTKAEGGWGNCDIADRVHGVLEVLVAMITSNTKLASFLPASLIELVSAVLHACRQSVDIPETEAKLPLSKCAASAISVLKHVVAKTQPTSRPLPSLLHDTFRVLTWYASNATRAESAALELECMECVAMLDEIGDTQLASCYQTLIACALSAATAPDLMKDQKGDVFFAYNNNQQSQPSRYMKKKISPDADWLRGMVLRRKEVALIVLNHHADKVKKEGLKVMDAFAATPRPWPWSLQEELFHAVSTWVQAIQSPALSQAVIAFITNEHKVKNKGDASFRNGILSAGVDLLDFLLLRPLACCGWQPRVHLKTPGLVFGESGCRSLLRVLVTEAERIGDSWRKGEDTGVQGNASAFVMMSAVSKFKKKAASQNSDTETHSSHDAKYIGTVWRLILLISITPPKNPLSRLCGTFVDVPEVEDLVKVAAVDVLYSERKPSVEVTAAVLSALSAAASHPQRLYDGMLPASWVAIAVAAAKLLRCSDWAVVESAAMFLRQLAVVALSTEEDDGDNDEFICEFDELDPQPHRIQLSLAVRDDGVITLVVQSLRKMVASDNTQSPDLAVSTLESLLKVLDSSSTNTDGCKTVRTKQPIDILLTSIDVAETLELEVSVQLQAVARDAAAHAEALLSRLIEDEDIAQLLTEERERLENEGPSVPVKRLGILLELCAHRVFVKSGKSVDKEQTKAAKSRAATLKKARAGGIGLILDALTFAVEEGLDKASYNAIDTFVRSANCYQGEPEQEENNKSLDRTSSTVRFTISLNVAKSLLEVTTQEMNRAVGLILKSLRTHAISSPQGISVATNALITLSHNHPLAAAALAGSVGKLGCLDSDSEEEGEEDDFDPMNADRSFFSALLPGLRLVHGLAPPRAVLACLLSLVRDDAPAETENSQVFKLSKIVIRGALRDQTDKLVSVMLESVQGLDLRVESDVSDCDERFNIVADAVALLLLLVAEEAEQHPDTVMEGLPSKLLKLASDQPSMLMLGVITDICESLLVVTEYGSAAFTLVEKTHSHVSPCLLQLVRNMLTLCLKLADCHTVPIMFEVGLVARLIHLVEYSRSLILDLTCASIMVRLLHALSQHDDFLSELVNLAAVGSCLCLSSSHPQEVELATLASEAVARLSSIDDFTSDEIDEAETKDPGGDLCVIEEEEEDAQRPEGEDQQLREEDAKKAETERVAREDKHKLKAEIRLKRLEEKHNADQEIAQIVEDCAVVAQSSLKSLSAVDASKPDDVVAALRDYSTRHQEAIEQTMVRQENPSHELEDKVVGAVVAATAELTKTTDATLVVLMESLQHSNKNQNTVLAVAETVHCSSPAVSRAGLECLRQLTENEAPVIDMSDYLEDKVPDPEVFLEEEEITTGWEKIWSDEHEIDYYHNYDTEETVWEEPEDFAAQAAERTRLFEEKKKSLKNEVILGIREIKRETEFEKRKTDAIARRAALLPDRVNSIISSLEEEQSQSEILVNMLSECGGEEEFGSLLLTTTANVRKLLDEVKLTVRGSSEEALLINKLSRRLALASELSLVPCAQQQQVEADLLVICEATASLLAKDGANNSLARQEAVGSCCYALWRVAASGEPAAVERTLTHIEHTATSISTINAVKRTTQALVESGKISRSPEQEIEADDSEDDSDVELVKPSRESSKNHKATPDALTAAMSSVGSAGGAKSMTALIKVVTKDPSKVESVLRSLLDSIEGVVDVIDVAPKDRELKDEFEELCQLAQVLHSLCSLSSISEKQLGTLQPRLGLVLQRSLQTSIRSVSVAPDEQQRLVQTLLALLARLTYITSEGLEDKSVIEQGEDAATMMNKLTLDVLSETMEVPTVTVAAHKALNNIVKQGGKTTVSVVKNHPVISKMRSNSSGSSSTNLVNSSPSRAAGGRRASAIPQLPKRHSLLTGSESSESLEQSQNECVGTLVLSQFAVSSIVDTVHSGDANKVVEALMHISSPKTMLTTVSQLANALLPDPPDGVLPRMPPQVALEMLLDIAARLHTGGSAIDSAGADEGGAFCGVPVLLMLLEADLSKCFEAVCKGNGLERDSSELEMEEVGMLVALATISTPRRLAPLVACLHLDACLHVLDATATHPAGLRAMGAIAHMLLEQSIAPPKMFLKALATSKELNQYARIHSDTIIADINANESLCSVLASQVTAADALLANATARLERWRRTAYLLKKACEDSEAHSTGAGRGLGAGEAFDEAFLSAKAGKGSSMDFLMSSLAFAARMMITPESSDIGIKELWAADFARSIVAAALSLVKRRGGAKVAMKHGHVALGTLHDLRQMADERLSRLAEALGYELEKALSGAPELLLHELVRSLHANVTSCATPAPARRLSTSANSDPMSTLIRCNELVTAMGKGVDNILPSVGAMLLTIAATGFNTFNNMPISEQEARSCVSSSIQLLRRLAKSRPQAKLLAQDRSTSTNLALCLLNFLPDLIEDFEEEEHKEEEEEEDENEKVTSEQAIEDEMVNWACSACTFENSVPKGAAIACDICGTAYSPPPPRPKPSKPAFKSPIRQRAATMFSTVDPSKALWFVAVLEDVLSLSSLLTASPAFVQSIISDLSAHEVTHERGEDMSDNSAMVIEPDQNIPGVLLRGKAVCCLFDVLSDAVLRVRASMRNELVAANLLLLTGVVVRTGSLRVIFTRKKQASVTLKALAKWRRKSIALNAARQALEADSLQNELFGGPRASQAITKSSSLAGMAVVPAVEVEEGSWVEECIGLIQSAFKSLCDHISENKTLLTASSVSVVAKPMSSLVPSLTPPSTSSIVVTPSIVVAPANNGVTMSSSKDSVDPHHNTGFLTLLKGLALLTSALLVECKKWARSFRNELRTNLTLILFGGENKSTNMDLLLSRALEPLAVSEGDASLDLKESEQAQRNLRRSTLDTTLHLLELVADLSNSDSCIEIMLFGTESGGEGAVPIGDGVIIDLVVKLMTSAPLWRVATMEEQRRLCLYSLRSLDHFATIDNPTSDAAASALLIKSSTPGAVIKVLRMQESSIAVQEAAVETLMSLAYSSSAVEVMHQKRCVPLLISIAETYEDATGLVLCCLQTLTLLLQNGDVAAFEDFTQNRGIQLFLRILDNSFTEQNQSQEVQAEMKDAALNLLSTLSRSSALCSALSMIGTAVPSIMRFLTRVLTSKEDEEEEHGARLEQAVDALKHLGENSFLNAAIGENGMHLILQLVGTALEDRKRQLLYLDLIKHLSIHDSNVKALVSKDGIALLIWILENTCNKSKNRRLSSGDESERELVKLQVVVLSTLGNMAIAHHEYASVIMNAGAQPVLDAVQKQATSADHYEVSACVRDVNSKLQQMWSRTQSRSISGNKPTLVVAPPPPGHRPDPSPAPVVAPTEDPVHRARPASMPEPMLHPSAKNLFENMAPIPLTAEEEDLQKRIEANVRIVDPLESVRRRNSLDSNGDAPLMGYLRKQGGGTSLLGRKSWKTRFFVLDGTVLYYYENEESMADSKPLNAQPYILSFCDVVLDDANGPDCTKYYFTVKPCGSRGGKGPLALEADSAATRNRWLTWLNNAQKVKAPGGW